MTTDPGAALGHVQRAVLLMLADETPRSAARIENDMLMSAGRVRGALERLGRRSLVERDHTSGDRSGDHGIQWSLTAAGLELARAVHHLDDEHPAPTCPHGREEDWPCRDCREGPWRCKTCGEIVRGGERAPHRRDVHGIWKYRRDAYEWAGEQA